MILVTGSNGLAGSSLRRVLSDDFMSCFADRSHADLRKYKEVDALIKNAQPSCVIHCAANVGGIFKNLAQPEEMLYDNLLMNANVIRSCINNSVKQLFAFSSVCVFPDGHMLEESRMHDGPVYEANFAYGYAKRMVDVHIRAAHKQYGVNYTSIIPSNIFGEVDNFSLADGHIVPAIIHKLYLAIQNKTDFVIAGDGSSLREFLYIDDLSRAITLMIGRETPQRVIVSGKEELSIKQVVEMLVEISGFEGRVVWDTSKPNGQYRRPSSKEVFNKVCPDFQYTPIKEGLEKTWVWFCDNYPNVRK